MAKMYPKKGAAPAPMVREEQAEAKMGKAAYARAEAAESPAKKAAESAKGYACGGKVKGHADGGEIVPKSDNFLARTVKGWVEKATRPTPKAASAPTTTVPAKPKREEMPEEPAGLGVSAPAAAMTTRRRINKNADALERAKEVDNPK